ncbi:hypothetical protein [Lysinibacillus sphaericus]|uniref:Uncharacterized protein n=2 Tax=Lysinibacillus sphaericus TaxID=1421 RepID=A0AAJ4ZVX0_LYSSH|nr:hypothetical protein [Lysinibacillus sphaericus]MED4543027.1 hypothetical protein [Lysinibacillus sphaericus]GEC83930.1 hypothetical protein LSP03_36730 [Lysinibacillus sphaericus]SUV17510.1 Uncharacterised protein [Lysinibacillus sphaericus]
MTEKEYLEFKSLLEMNDELNFYYKGEEYWISHNRGKSYLSRVKDQHSQEFNGYEELLEKGTIEGMKISEIYPEIKW